MRTVTAEEHATDGAANGDGPEPAPSEGACRSAGGVVRLALGIDVARLLAGDPVARLGEDPEGVHQARVATRRLRSHLSTFAVVLRGSPRAALSRELRWYGRSLGAVRDLDVLRGRVATTVRAFDPLTRQDGIVLLATVDADRERVARKLARVLDSPRYRKLVGTLATTVADPPFRRSAGLPADEFLVAVIRERLAALAEAIAALSPSPTDPELHAVRIAAKPLRYAAEAGVPVLGSRCARVSRRATDLCDVLGELNDGCKANEWLDALTVEPRQAFAVARVRATEIGRMADARGTWGTAWERVLAAAGELGWVGDVPQEGASPSLQSPSVHPDGDGPDGPSREDLATENQRLRLQLAEARREVFGWRAHVQSIAESRAVIVGRMMADAFARIAPRGTFRRRWAGKLTESLLWVRRRGQPVPPYATRRYRQYYAHTRPTPSALRSRTVALDYLERHVAVTVVVVCLGGDLAATLSTLRAQVYDRTEVLVVSDHPVQVPSPARTLVAEGGFERLANAGVTASEAEFVVVLRAGDLLSANAVFDLVAAVQDGADAAYGDEDRYDEAFEHHDGFLKPAELGYETLLSYDVVGAPLLVERARFTALCGYDEGRSPVAEHDFALRLCEATTRIAHVPAVLVSRPAADQPDPFDATAATIPVVTAAFERAGRTAQVTTGDIAPSVRYVVDPPVPQPSVAIVVPTRDRLDLLSACLESVERRSTYANYSVVICDNDSKEPETLEWLASAPYTVVACPGPFNYASIVNRGVATTDAEFIVTLNNDTTIATPDWLERLVGLCSLDGVGSVGVKLQYPDGRLQHEGVGIIPMPVHLSRDVNYDPVDRWLSSTRNAAAVTGACQIVRTEAWRELDGLDERLAVGYNDVDFGMRLCEAGWRVVYTPEVVLGHRESASRGDLHPPADEALLIARWDLFGEYLDPSMPPAVRYFTTKVEVDVPAPGT
jgi:CHAD domain-containing protein/GT2 family glycosyltransferase